MAQYDINVNAQKFTVDVDSDMPVLWVLRDELNLVGTKYGCGIAMCGACTIHIDGEAVRSCILPISSIGEKSITTIEGLSEKGDHPVQEAWKEHDVPQCGYCQAGQIMTAAALLHNNKSASEEDIENTMNANLCRCATYLRIKKATISASKNM